MSSQIHGNNFFIPIPQKSIPIQTVAEQIPSQSTLSKAFAINIQMAPQHPIADVIHAASKLVLNVASAIGTAALAFALTRYKITSGSEQVLQTALNAIMREQQNLMNAPI